LWPSRDYLLFCFNRKRVLSRKDINSNSRVPTEEMREVLEQIARQRPAQGWEFMFNTDVDFLQKHPETCTSQATLWVHKYKSLTGQLSINDDFPVADWKEADLPGLFGHLSRKPSTPRKRHSAPHDSTDSKSKPKEGRGRKLSQSSHSDVEDKVVVKEERLSPIRGNIDEPKSVKQRQKSTNKLKVIKNITQDILSTDDKDTDIVMKEPPLHSSNKHAISPELIQDTEKPGNEVEVEEDENSISDDIFIPPIASGLKSVIKQEKPPSEIFLKELKRFCRDTIRSGCISLFDLKEVLSVRQQESGSILCTGVSDELLVKCIADTNAMEISLKVDPKKEIPLEETRLFLYEKLGEQNDKFRRVIVNMFKKSVSLRRKDIFEELNRTLKEAPSSHSYSKMMAEFCENHNGQWYLNGAFQTIQKYS